MEITTKSPEETKALGEKIAADLVCTRQKALGNSSIVLALVGDLGSGKTTFVQGFAKGLGIKSRIISPTFILMRKCNLPISHQPLTANHLYHIDLYRLERNVKEEIMNLGFDEIISDPENIVVIEWAEKIKDMIPQTTIWIKFENLDENTRKIILRHWIR